VVEAVLAYTIKAIDESSSVMDKIKSSVGLLGSSLSELGGPLAGVGQIMTGFAAGGPAGAGIAALGQVSEYLQGAIKDAGESERVFTALGKAITNQGGNWDELKSHVQGVLNTMQSTSRFSDEELAASLRTLVSAGMPVEQALKALKTAMDAAVGSGQPLNTVSTDIAKAFGGQESALTRLVPGMADLVKQLGPGATEGQKFDAVMAGLNQKFGGQAASDAATYAGTQERLKNAMGELGEKVGTILTPALTGMTNALIPMVDGLGKGVDAVSAWLTQVGKMPEVQGIIAAVNDAFSGLGKYLEGLWKFFVDNFGPALTELMDAFKELWDALSPIGDALKELLGAFGDTGNLDLFKTIITGIVFEIKGIATIIKDVAPYIKQFADAFKAAADFITPILKEIHDATTGFLDALKNAFQGFYNWLVGASLWTDMWNQMLVIASRLIGQLLSDLGSKLFEPMKNAFTNATEAIQKIWSDSWNAVKTISDNLLSKVQTFLNTKFDEMKTYVSTSTGTYGPTMTAALSGMQSAMNAGFALVKGDWQGALDNLKQALGSWGDAAEGLMGGIMGDLKTALDQGVSAMQGTWNSMTSGLQSTMQAAGPPLQSATESVMNTVTGAFQGAFTTISNAATGFWNWLVGGSLWPDMLKRMNDQTDSATKQLTAAFQKLMDLGGPFGDFVEGAQGTIDKLGISVTDASGKMRSATDLAQSFIQALKDGRVTIDELSGVFQSAGGSSDAFKTKLTDIQNIEQSLRSNTDFLQNATAQLASAVEATMKQEEGLGYFMEGQADTLSKLGISLTDVNGNMRSAADIAADLTNAFRDGKLTFDEYLAEFTALHSQLNVAGSALADFATSTKSAMDTVQARVSTSMRNVQAIMEDSMTKTSQVTGSFLQTIQQTWQDTQTTIKESVTAFFKWTIAEFAEALTFLTNVWQTAWEQIETIVADIYTNIESRSTAWWQQLNSLATAGLTQLTGQFQSGLTAIQNTFASTFSGMVATAQSSMATIVASAASALAQVQAMQSQASAAYMSMATMGAPVTVTSPASASPASAPATVASPSVTVTSSPTNITLNNTVKVDGQTVAKQVETRIVNRIVDNMKKAA
jgi:hypothetical protein